MNPIHLGVVLGFVATLFVASACSSSTSDTSGDACKAGTQCVCTEGCTKSCGGDGANCDFVCQSGTCAFSCPGGGCQVSGSGSPTLDCPKGGCRLSCDGPSCKLTSCTSNCTMACGATTTTCQSSCADTAAGCVGGGG